MGTWWSWSAACSSSSHLRKPQIVTSSYALCSLAICVILGQTLGERRFAARHYGNLCKASHLRETSFSPCLPLHFAFSTPTSVLCKQPAAAAVLPRWEHAEKSLVHSNVCNHSSCFYSIYSMKQCLYLQYLVFIYHLFSLKLFLKRRLSNNNVG